ncbi:hypothetical protein OZX67_00710 [Bifidobacterium sp. ESL0728]|uniref:hypothetical protein n=1 Tax=Bifidobacterium sp. ESL0728 TaxID=2983220 RepID=UPI0023F832B1|nr:hypothetical protein [Bifidobacterium sp. ESL0728]WEV59131.1 hypothetical protein OZX67_00710 [Bifidobacterium sp. ESL0728]
MKDGVLDFDDFPPEEAAMLRADVEEAERGYTEEQLNHCKMRYPGHPLLTARANISRHISNIKADHRHPGRPLAVGETRADSVIRVRLDSARKNALETYMKKNHITNLSTAVRQLLDIALASE